MDDSDKDHISLNKLAVPKMKRVKTMADEDDKFNKLHDDQIRQIINFLPTKDAIRTSVFSSRWKNLCRCISNIDLEGLSFDSILHEVSFFESIDKLLDHHDASDIKRFYFSSNHNFTYPSRIPNRILQWIAKVIKHNVQQLCISFYLLSDFTLPLSLFNSESLTVFELDLKLNSRSITLGSREESSSVPSLVHLPSLKRLKLSRVVFTDNHSTQCFFCNIPNLQQLCLYKCDWKNVDSLIIDIPTLEGLDVCIRHTFTHRTDNCQVKVIAPKLTSLKCDTDFSADFHLSNHSMPLSVVLKFYFQHGRYVPQHLPLTILHSIKEATSLHMVWDNKTDKYLFGRIADEDLPRFMNLKHLEISAHNFDPVGDIQLRKIFKFLQKMPYIESFMINVPDCNVSVDFDMQIFFIKDGWPKGDVPSCVITQIKSFTIITSEDLRTRAPADKRVEYFSTALDLIKYFMDHSQILGTLEINWLCSSSRPTPDLLDEVERHPRYSELKRFSCPPGIIPEPQLMPFPWENEDPNDMDIYF